MTPLSPLADLLDLQAGVISRKQALALPGEADATVRRRLRRREWVVVHPGVYVNHTGELTWIQRAWAATLAVAPSALSHTSAIRAADGPGRKQHDDTSPIHVAVDQRRTVEAPSGVIVHRTRYFDQRAQMNLSPPRVRIEHAVLACAADAVDARDAIAVLSDAIRSRRTTPGRLQAALESHTRIAHRVFLAGVLADAASGTHSVLELEYLRRVERAHGLPRLHRQKAEATGAGQVYRDGAYELFGLLLELDGRLGHTTSTERDRDFERDLDAALTNRVTIRLGWIQVVDRPCATAAKLAVLLRLHGWRGALRRCPDCPSEDRVVLLSHGDRNPTR